MHKPQINDRWQDAAGQLVTITYMAFNRVRFVRDGYEFPVTLAEDRFVKEFSFVSEVLPE